MRTRVRARRTALDLVLILLIAAVATSDAAAQAPAVRDAERFRTEGDLNAAVNVLRDHLTRQPNDGEAARLLAQTLYWQHDIAGAERAYEEALRRHPEDSTLRLQYGRMLVETRAWNRARVLLTPLIQQPATHIDATMLLGTMAY
jgi:cytochrome c-type biogenesis protein CcmH/NrfG